MQCQYDDVPNSRAFPVRRIAARWRDYFTSSFAYMLAMAIDEEYGEIHAYGVDCCDAWEYVAQRPCNEYWLGVAEALGTKLYMPEKCRMLKQPFRYGYQDSLSDRLENAVARWMAHQATSARPSQVR